jgi:RND family efflux transporter MFP subunit
VASDWKVACCSDARACASEAQFSGPPQRLREVHLRGVGGKAFPRVRTGVAFLQERAEVALAIEAGIQLGKEGASRLAGAFPGGHLAGTRRLQPGLTGQRTVPGLRQGLRGAGLREQRGNGKQQRAHGPCAHAQNARPHPIESAGHRSLLVCCTAHPPAPQDYAVAPYTGKKAPGGPALKIRGCCRFAVAVCISLAATFSFAQAAHDCLIEPAQTVEVGSPGTGLLEKVLVRRGDRVTQGQVVAVLESRAESAAAELARLKSEAKGPQQAAREKMEFAQRKFQRRSEMAAQRLGSVQERDDAEAELAQARAELLLAQETVQQARQEYQQQSSMLNLRSVRSPFHGVVVDQMLFPGEIVDGSGNKRAILKLAQLDPLRVRAIVPMKLFGTIKPGATIEIVPELPSRSGHTAVVRSVDRLVDAASGTFTVVAEMPNRQLDVPAGIRCKARF